MGNHIIVNEKRYPVLGSVKLWTETGLEVTPKRGARKRRRPLDLGVWHWSGGEGSAKTLFRVLHRKGYGIEFFIDHMGVIWQFCDPCKVDTFDAGSFNDRSFGVEIANYGFRRRRADIPRRGRIRKTYTCELNGRRRRFAHFFPWQIAAAISLADTMSTACPQIARCVPVYDAPDGSQQVIASTMSGETLGGYQGHLGHFHLTNRKSDPGLDLLNAFRAVWLHKL